MRRKVVEITQCGQCPKWAKNAAPFLGTCAALGTAVHWAGPPPDTCPLPDAPDNVDDDMIVIDLNRPPPEMKDWKWEKGPKGGLVLRYVGSRRDVQEGSP